MLEFKLFVLISVINVDGHNSGEQKLPPTLPKRVSSAVGEDNDVGEDSHPRCLCPMLLLHLLGAI